MTDLSSDSPATMMTDREGDTRRWGGTVLREEPTLGKYLLSPKPSTESSLWIPNLPTDSAQAWSGCGHGKDPAGLRWSTSTEAGGRYLTADHLRSPGNRIREHTNTDKNRGAPEPRKGGPHSPAHSTAGGHVSSHKTTESPVSTQGALSLWGPETTNPLIVHSGGFS